MDILFAVRSAWRMMTRSWIVVTKSRRARFGFHFITRVSKFVSHLMLFHVALKC